MTPSDLLPYAILDRKRRGETLGAEQIGAVVDGAVDGSWSDAQLGAFLMAVAVQGLDPGETRAFTAAMLGSGERWELSKECPVVVDKHSTGGVGDKVSLLLAPILAAAQLPVVMLTGRGLGHTGGTADKLEAIPGVGLDLDRERCLRLLESVGMAIGVSTPAIAPADRRLYPLRDATATVSSLPLVTGSILSKKLAVGASGIVFDVKAGEGAFFPELDEAERLARLLTDTAVALGQPARALLTDMSQPLGRWVGHGAEVVEVLEALAGEGEERLMEVTYSLCQEASRLVGKGLSRDRLESVVASGAARQRFEEWARAQGARDPWPASPACPLAPVEVVFKSPRRGVLSRVATRRLGLLMAQAAGAGIPGGDLDHGVALRYPVRLGQSVERGEELGRVFLRRQDPALVREIEGCFVVGEEAGPPPPVIYRRVDPSVS